MIGQVINLERAPERWASVARIAAERGLVVVRVPAVDGRDPAAAAAAVAAPGHGLGAGEVGCFESHRRAWAAIAAGGEARGLVLEDDVYLAAGIVGFLAALDAVTGLDLVKLNAHRRGLIVRSRPVALVAGRRLWTPVQTTSDSSAYVITRDFAARALAFHAGYARPLDLALFDPATGARVAQVDPGLAIQQRHASFRFLDGGARKTDIQDGRVRGPGRGPLASVAREAARIWRRRIVPVSQPVLNLGRRTEDRRALKRIAFDG